MANVKLLDAGFSLQLQSHVNEKVDGHPLWTARYIRDNPQAVIQTHRDFIRAGSEIIRSNTYQATVDGFGKYLGLTKEESVATIKEAIHLVRKAIKEEDKVGSVEVAGSIGPYGASLHDGSEYTGSYVNSVSMDQLIEWHSDRVQAVISCGINLLALETIPCSKEAVALCKLIKRYPQVKVWISFSIKDEESISDGEKFVDAITAVLSELSSDQLVAVGVNCVDPRLVSPLLSKARAVFPHLPFVVYPNSGEHYNKQLERWELVDDMRPVSDYIRDWLELGVTLVGGCCRTTTLDLTSILTIIKQWTSSKN